MAGELASWQQARRRVIEVACALAAERPARVETVALGEAAGRRLAETVALDRDQPPFDRSTRDGFAVHADDAAAPGRALRVIGEARAGAGFAGRVEPGACVEIMTGAPVPAGAAAVVMVEHARRGEDGTVRLERGAGAGENVVATGAEGRRGQLVLAAGTRLSPPQIALAASVGAARVAVRARPRVAVLSTGDEIVPVEATPGPSQIRNSNGASLAAQIARAGGEPLVMPRVADDQAALAAAIARALAEAEVLVFSGGVSAGKYDLVEPALAAAGASTVFDGVAIRPGKPTVFGRIGGHGLWFGLPGNPLSTMVTFELFARPALEALAGGQPGALALASLPLAAPVGGGRPLPLAQFLPVAVDTDEAGAARARPLASQGSGDLVAMGGADGWVVVAPDAGRVEAGTPLPFLPA